jgi:exonuclease VII large subunit
MQTYVTEQVHDNYKAFAPLEQSFRHFNAAQIAALNYQLTDDEQYAKHVADHLKRAIMEGQEIRHFSMPDVCRELVSTLTRLYDQFEDAHIDDVKIGERIKKVMLDSPEEQELEKLLAMRQEVRAMQTKLADEVRERNEQLSELQAKLLHESERDLMVYAAQSSWLITICTVVAVILVIAVGFIVVQKVNRNTATYSQDYSEDGFSRPEPTGDLRLVADRLQEVVNLLRK